LVANPASVQVAVDVAAGDEVEMNTFELADSLVFHEIVAPVVERLLTLIPEMIGATVSAMLAVTNEPCEDVAVLFATSLFTMMK
jgi:hypothetical protein